MVYRVTARAIQRNPVSNKQTNKQTNKKERKSETKQTSSCCPYLINTVLEILATVRRQPKEIKELQTEKEKVKIPVFTDTLIVKKCDPKILPRTPTPDKHLQRSGLIQN